MPRKNSVCQTCQARHLKCVRDEQSGPCRRCKNENLVCAQDSSLRVRKVVSVSRGKRKHLDYAEDQVWVPVPASLSFASPEEQGVTSFPHEQELQVEILQQKQNSSPAATWTTSDSRYQPESGVFSGQEQSLQGSPAVSKNTPNTQYEYPAIPHSQRQPPSPSLQRSTTAYNFDHHSPGFGSTSSVFTPISNSSPRTQITSTSHQNSTTAWPFESSHESRLFLHFVNRLSYWLDGLDSKRHFGTEVPRRAASVPVIMNAILASAARHIAFTSRTTDTTSERYHNKCLQILIPVLDDPGDVLDENLCAAIIILRQYEEYDETDERCHLFGSTRMVNSITPNTTPSSLRDAANWIALRQEIHISLTNKQPVSIILDAYRQSPKFRSESEDGWANRIVFLFAKVLNYAFRSEDTVPEESWSSLQDQVEAWNMTKPAYFAPLWSEDPSEQRETPFPEAVMLGSAQANGMQHYCLAKILLAAYDPRLLKLGFDARKLRKESEETVLQNLRMVIGLAASNPHIEITFMHASHILIACGDYFTDTYEQDAILKFLQSIEERGIWRTSSIIGRLREQWKQEDR